MFNTLTVTHYLDNKSKIPCVSVPLTNIDKKVYLRQDDFYRIISQGLDARWRLENNQIIERGTRLSVTRLVAQADHGQRVLLIDKDPCNLKRDNLAIGKGGTGSNVSQRLADVDTRLRVARTKTKIKHEY